MSDDYYKKPMMRSFAYIFYNSSKMNILARIYFILLCQICFTIIWPSSFGKDWPSRYGGSIRQNSNMQKSSLQLVHWLMQTDLNFRFYSNLG